MAIVLCTYNCRVFSLSTSQEIGRQAHLRYDLCCGESDVKWIVLLS